MRPAILHARLKEAGEPLSETELYQVLKQKLFVKRVISYKNVEYSVNPNHSAIAAIIRQLKSLEKPIDDRLDDWLSQLSKSDRAGRQCVTYAAVYTDLTELALIAVEYFFEAATRRISGTYKPWVEAISEYEAMRLLHQRLTQLAKHLNLNPQSGNQAAVDWNGEVAALRTDKLTAAMRLRPETNIPRLTKSINGQT